MEKYKDKVVDFFIKHRINIENIQTITNYLSIVSILVLGLSIDKDFFMYDFLKNLKTFFSGWWIIIVLLFPVFPIITEKIYKKHDQNLSLSKEKVLGNILHSFNQIVAIKLKRFVNYKVKKNENPFMTITKPDEQIKFLLEQLYYILEKLNTNDKIKLFCIKVNEAGFGEVFHYPISAAPSIINEKDYSGTFVELVLKEKSFQVIEDLDAEFNMQHNSRKKKKYKFLNGYENGAIIGYPIIRYQTRDKVDYVITIKTEAPIKNNKKFKQDVKLITDNYLHRFQLEIELARIKKEWEELTSNTTSGTTIDGGVF